MLLSLASPSKQAQAYLDKYNITAYDSQGAFVGITNLADQLQSKLGAVDRRAAQRGPVDDLRHRRDPRRERPLHRRREEASGVHRREQRGRVRGPAGVEEARQPQR
jgi:hypothetical protein